MNDNEWTEAVEGLARATDRIGLLVRCLALPEQLSSWRQNHDEFSGGDASNALDQAAGLLVELRDGGARDLLQLVEGLRAELPTPWE
ncbi:hypothetical protein [Cellulomonas soli]|uniref:Uncharacterized protein n=1 Tax=Cellulomonas soli TaxID=931535 RepID=A0A512PFI2_9CELL|nr:hypothetical protein [Cellulomonas soli]NYI59891.1 hypothetical protein [Cellulomonas soli]GEP69965.1 hypothetical protein CSO01_26800 [Cellulomonas soli]